jgi:hypothetical protein
MLPAAIVFSIIHEMGPVVTGLVVGGRVGAGIGAEVGSMNVTEQIDAIEASAVNPYKLLAVTRIVPGYGHDKLRRERLRSTHENGLLKVAMGSHSRYGACRV